MLEMLTSVNSALNGFVWGPVMLALLVGTGIYLTCRTGWIQVRRFGYIMKSTVGSLFRKSEKDHGSNLSPFQAVTTALAGTVGTGNIAGVTGAIFVGGPGAVFWMWVSAFFGMCTKYAEIALSIQYRETDEGGAHRGDVYKRQALMGANMQRQAVPLLRPEAPIVATGQEHKNLSLIHIFGRQSQLWQDHLVQQFDRRKPVCGQLARRNGRKEGRQAEGL